MLQTLREYHNKTCIKLNEDFKKDVKWFATFLPIFNGVTFFDKRPPKATIGLHTATTCLGAAFGSFVYSFNISSENVKGSIVHIEMLNILVALRLWGKLWHKNRIVIYCDNQAAVSVLNTGKSVDKLLVQ